MAYHVQFERIAKTYGWDIETKLEKLIESLRGKAASYFGKLPVKSCFHNQKAVYGELGKVTFENPITKDPSPASLNKSNSNLINDQLAVTLQKLTSVLEAFQKPNCAG